jgi:alpha-1,3-rhamnosyl/mannosyltransferase
MRVIINCMSAKGRKTGIGHHTAELLRCLHRQAAPDVVDEFPQPWLRRAREALRRSPPPHQGDDRPPAPRAQPTRQTFRQSARYCLGRAGRMAFDQYFRLLCACSGYDLYHEPNFLPLPCATPTLVTLHDLSVLLHPEWHPAERLAEYERVFPRAMRQAVHFLTVSEFVRQEVIRHLNVAPERVTRVYNGVRPGLSPLPPGEVAAALHLLDLPPRYLLYLGTIEPRKNVLTLLRAYCSLPAPLRDRWPLLLVGGWGWHTEAVAEFYHAEARHRGVRHLGYLADEYLGVVYNGARALVFPSFYEGFGLPPVEMLACGGAVLASTAGAVAETVGSRAHLVEPEDTDGWRRALARVLEDDDWWQGLRRGAVEAAGPYTWERAAAETLGVYRALTGAGAGGRAPARKAA